MLIVLFAALGVGGATVLGALIGLALKKVRDTRLLTAFSAGMMLAAAVVGLIIPGITSPSDADTWLTLGGILFGAVCLGMGDRLLPQAPDKSRAMLLVLAIALHNAPEGLAAGVSFGCTDKADTLLILGSLMLQNIPEGMIVIPPMLSAGYGLKKSFLYALGTGVIEVIGTFCGYFCMKLSQALLPAALGFAGGAMLFVVCGEMIPQSVAGNRKQGLYLLLLGLETALLADALLG